MKEYRTLTIAGTRQVLLATVTEIEAALCDGWTRNRQIEVDGLARTSQSPEEIRFCLNCTPTTSRKGALLVLMGNTDGNLWLANIVPDEPGRLTKDEFNYILEEFLQKFARPAAQRTGATIEASSGVVTLEDWFSKDTANQLRRFLHFSHGNTSHPNDYKRWMSFLVSANREDAKVHGDLLRAWLIEDAGCEEYTADQLASEYQFSRDYAEAYAGA